MWWRSVKVAWTDKAQWVVPSGKVWHWSHFYSAWEKSQMLNLFCAIPDAQVDGPTLIIPWHIFHVSQKVIHNQNHLTMPSNNIIQPHRFPSLLPPSWKSWVMWDIVSSGPEQQDWHQWAVSILQHSVPAAWGSYGTRRWSLHQWDWGSDAGTTLAGEDMTETSYSHLRPKGKVNAITVFRYVPNCLPASVSVSHSLPHPPPPPTSNEPWFIQ